MLNSQPPCAGIVTVESVTTKERLTLHDRQIAAIRSLVQKGMRLVVDTRKDLRKLAATEQRTQEKLELLMDTLRRGPNGHSKPYR